MLTLTLSDDCTELVIESEYQADDNQSVTLTVTLNCTTTYDDIDIDVEDADYTLDADSLELDELEDGVYTIKVVTVDVNGEVYTEIQCILIDCGLDCDMLDVYQDITDEDNIVKALSYHALKAMEACAPCTCADWCTLYNVATGIDDCVENDSSCGCS